MHLVNSSQNFQSLLIKRSASSWGCYNHPRGIPACDVAIYDSRLCPCLLQKDLTHEGGRAVLLRYCLFKSIVIW